MKTEADDFVNKYDGIEVKFIPGHNPDLVLYGEGNEELERIDLTKLKEGKAPGVADLHVLLEKKGFKVKEEVAEADGGCADTAADCASWAAAGECTSNPGFMHASCPKSCGTCPGMAGDPAASPVKDEM